MSELYPRSIRNEGCTISDWLMLNLYAGMLTGSDEAYAKAENILWNAMYFNQMITGGFGHRDFSSHEWKTYASGPIGEAWWCCTEHCGLGMTEYARHAVVRREDTIEVNLLTSGDFTIAIDGQPDVVVEVRTDYPATADTFITVRNLPETMDIKVRTPSCIKEAAQEEVTQADGSTLIRLTGKMGHYLEPYAQGQLLKYGPLILAPMAYYWNPDDNWDDIGLPEGYLPETNPGIPQIVAPASDANGFVDFEDKELPDWTYFDEGPGAELAVENAAANIPLKFEDGTEKTLRFWPMCEVTSTLSTYETPLLFRK